MTDIWNMSGLTDARRTEGIEMIADAAKDWSNIVHDRRVEYGLSQADLAGRIGMSRQWVSGFENGNAAKTPLSLALRITAVLDIDVELTRRSIG